jgi:putative NADH-flavin reductase
VTLFLLFASYAIALSIALACAGHWTTADRRGGAFRDRRMRVLIIGATGGTGRELVAQALERGHTVTALVRDPSKLQERHPLLIVVRGDVLDETSLGTAMADQEAVLSALGHKRFFHPTRILSAGTRNILRAMETHGVRRLVAETALGIGDSAGRLGLYYTLFVIPVILPFYFWDKTRQECAIAKSNADWVIVRPAMLTNGDKRRVYRHGANVGSFFWSGRISRADVADFMLNQLASDTYLRTAPGVCG